MTGFIYIYIYNRDGLCPLRGPAAAGKKFDALNITQRSRSILAVYERAEELSMASRFRVIDYYRLCIHR